jgi:molecular chaperone DnaK
MGTPIAVGIDLGTTYSVVAKVDPQGRSAIVRNLHGDLLTPSVVLFDDEEIVVGKAAKKAANETPDRVAECAKREIGSSFYSRPIQGQQIPPEAILGYILSRLKEDVTSTVGSDFRAVVTVPAYFDEPRRKATADAAQIAGIDLLDIVNEPTAAALAFGEQLGYLSATGEPQNRMRVLVYDLGGGTFDVTIIELASGKIQTLATDGDVQLGGRDWDQLLANHVAERFQAQHGIDISSDPMAMENLVRTVEDSKHTLSLREHAVVRVEYQGISDEIKVHRSEFEKMSQGLLERTSFTTRQVLTAARLQWSDISCILLVGGSTRMPMVSAMIEQLSGSSPDRSINPDEAVARGAALFASYQLTKQAGDQETKFHVTDVCAHSLGIQGIDQGTLRRENMIVIPRNTPLPARVMRPFVTQSAGQQSVVVLVLEGESTDPGLCSQIGRSVLRQLPANLPKGHVVQITFVYETNARLSVEATIPELDHRVTVELERERGLSVAELGRWRQIVEQQERANLASLLDEALEIDTEVGPTPDQQPTDKQPPPAKTARPNTAGNGSPANPLRDTPTNKLPASESLATETSPQSSSSATRTTSMPAGEEIKEPVAGGAAAVSYEPDPETERKRQKRIRRIIFLIGNVVSAAIGLTVGYYILCKLRPEADFLHWFSQ